MMPVDQERRSNRPGWSGHLCRHVAPAVLFLAGASWALAQYKVNSQLSAPPAQAGSIRYSPGYQTRQLPSEDRFAARSSGLLPSEHRSLGFQSGALPSQGSYTYLNRSSARYSPNLASSYSANNSARYSAPPAYSTGLSYGSAPPVRPYQPTPSRSSPISAVRPTSPLPAYGGGSIRYSR
jgi:hypothetical protein